MGSYESFAGAYDALTEDVAYARRAEKAEPEEARPRRRRRRRAASRQE